MKRVIATHFAEDDGDLATTLKDADTPGEHVYSSPDDSLALVIENNPESDYPLASLREGRRKAASV
ncbi:MAG TPA: hypothetical protein VF614_13445 [Chthoniobacteraceae bacterium]|jgi:hypothetical protein